MVIHGLQIFSETGSRLFKVTVLDVLINKKGVSFALSPVEFGDVSFLGVGHSKFV